MAHGRFMTFCTIILSEQSFCSLGAQAVGPGANPTLGINFKSCYFFMVTYFGNKQYQLMKHVSYTLGSKEKLNKQYQLMKHVSYTLGPKETQSKEWRQPEGSLTRSR